MKCYKCKASIPEEATFCPFCKAPQGFSADLIHRAGANDQTAITELYNRTYSNVYYTIKSMVKDEDTALDILQDSYLKAFRSLDQLQDPSKFRAWIKRIAHNRTVDVLRQTKTVTFSDLEYDDPDMPIEFEDARPDHLPDVVIVKQETARLMREILDSLPADQRAVVSMFYYEQMSVKEIAEELGVSENTVKSRLNYGRKKIETQVKALEKKGTKLYSLAPLPFLLLLFKSQEAYAAEIPAASVLHSISAGMAAEATTAGSVSAAGKVAAKAAAKTAKHALRTKIIAGVTAVAIVGGGGTALYRHYADSRPPIVQEAQMFPQDFLMDMEALAEKRMATLLADHDYLGMHINGCTYDITTEHIRLENIRLTKDSVYLRTGGQDSLVVVYEGDVHLSDDYWDDFAVSDSLPNDYPNAVIAFVLNRFPRGWFLQEDGSIVYDDNDFWFYGLYESRQDFDEVIREQLSYVDHEYHEVTLP